MPNTYSEELSEMHPTHEMHYGKAHRPSSWVCRPCLRQPVGHCL